MYYTSSGGGTSGYSGQDGGHHYYDSPSDIPPPPGSVPDPSSRMMGGSGMSQNDDMEYGQLSQSAYTGAAAWVDSSLASAQRSLQSWKSVGLLAPSAASLGWERPTGMDPSPNMTSDNLPSPGTVSYTHLTLPTNREV